MSNHWHAVIEAPQANLARGMRWLLGTYTESFNRRHRQWGHLFGGRYKAQLIDQRTRGYLRCACDYVHWNPRRAGLLAAGERLENYAWSSYSAYLRPRLRHGLAPSRSSSRRARPARDTAASRWEFARRVEASAAEREEHAALRRGWELGGEDFVDWLADKLAPDEKKPGTRCRDEREVDEILAERLARIVCARSDGTKRRCKGRPRETR